MSVALIMLIRAQRSVLGAPADMGTSMARLRVAGAPMSHEGSFGGAATAVTVEIPPSRSDTAPPSDYAESVAAARKSLNSGAWGRN